MACGQTGMWADKQTERHVDIKGRRPKLSDRKARRQVDIPRLTDLIHVRAFL